MEHQPIHVFDWQGQLVMSQWCDQLWLP